MALRLVTESEQSAADPIDIGYTLGDEVATVDTALVALRRTRGCKGLSSPCLKAVETVVAMLERNRDGLGRRS
jgi:hypothetical protein